MTAAKSSEDFSEMSLAPNQKNNPQNQREDEEPT
jgi:hypothetical protein